MHLANVDWTPDSPLLLADLPDAPADVDRSERTLRLQHLERHAEGFALQVGGATLDVYVRAPFAAAQHKYTPAKVMRDMGRVLASPMPGALISVAVEAGEEVEEGQECAVVEAMKMQNVLRAPRKGKVKAIKAKAGATLKLDDIIIEFE